MIKMVCQRLLLNPKRLVSLFISKSTAGRQRYPSTQMNRELATKVRATLPLLGLRASASCGTWPTNSVSAAPGPTMLLASRSLGTLSFPMGPPRPGAAPWKMEFKFTPGLRCRGPRFFHAGFAFPRSTSPVLINIKINDANKSMF